MICTKTKIGSFISFELKHRNMGIVLQGSISRKTGKWKQLSWFCSPPPSSTTARYSFEEFSNVYASREDRVYFTNTYIPSPLNEPFVHKNSSIPYYVNPSTLLFPPQDKKVHAQYNCNHPIYTKGVSLTPTRLNYL